MIFHNIEDYLEEINSQQFKSGMEAALKHTQRTGRETGFYVNYSDSFGFVYDDIEVGTKDSLGDEIVFEAMNAAAINLFGRTYDKLREEEVYRVLDHIDKEQDIQFSVKHPNPEKKLVSDYIRLVDEDARYLWHNVMMFHTHPYLDIEANLVPSPNDLGVLDYNEIMNEDRCKPISIIAGVYSESCNDFPILIFQRKGKPERNSEYIRLASDFDSKDEMHLMLPNDARLIKRLGTNLSRIDYQKEKNKSYHIWKGTYKMQEGFFERHSPNLETKNSIESRTYIF